MTYLGICPGHVRSSSFHSSFFLGEAANVRLWWLESTPFRLAVVQQCLKPGCERVCASFVQWISLASHLKDTKKSFGGGSMGPANLTGEKWIPKKRTKVKGVSRVYWPHFWFMLWSVLVLSSPSSPPMCSTAGESTETSWIWPQDGAPLCKLQAEPPKEPRKEKGQKWDW